MDVTNPGVVNVADETYGNPSPNGGTQRWIPRERGVLLPAADEGYPPAANGVESSVFSTPADVPVTELPFLFPTPSSPVPDATEVNVDAQSIGQGSFVPYDPSNLAFGLKFVGPAEFIVVGPAESFQTNLTEQDLVALIVTAVADADNPLVPPGPNTTRYVLYTAPPSLASYPVSVLGRQVTWDDLSSNPGAVRNITSYGGNFVVVNRQDVTPSNGNVANLATPLAGDVVSLDVNRQGAEPVVDWGETSNVVIFPDPSPFVPNPGQAGSSDGSFNASTGPQPGQVILTSGTVVPTAANVLVPNQAPPVGPGLPANVYV